MTNLRTDEIVFFRILTKIGTDENTTIHSSYFIASQAIYKNVCLEVSGNP